MLQRSLKLVYTALGMVCLVVGIIGIFVPLLPTTPFILIAAWLFSKSSERLHRWLISRPVVGPMILDWRESGVIRPRAKAAATVAIMVAIGATALFVPAPTWARIAVLLLGAGLLTFILTRRSHPADSAVLPSSKT